MNKKNEMISNEEIVGGWEKICEEYKPREFSPAEKAAIIKQKGIEDAAKLTPFVLS